MAIRRTKHAVYDLKYHLVWILKYRKQIFNPEIAAYLKEVFQHIAKEFDFRIDTMEVMADHVHVFTEAPPRYSPAEIVQIMKSISAREVFKKFQSLRKLSGRANCGMTDTLSGVLAMKSLLTLSAVILNTRLMKKTPIS
jgi:putative transposase